MINTTFSHLLQCDMKHFGNDCKYTEGTYGDVYCAVHKKDKSIVALKRILLHNEK